MSMIVAQTEQVVIPAGMTAAQFALQDDPWWLILIKAVLLFVIAVMLTLFNIWLERRVVARMQNRVGPNRHGPFGLLQSLSDGVKLALKEDITPKGADKVTYTLAPIIATIPAFLAFAVLPFGPVVDVPFSDQTTALQLIDPNVGVLVILAITSVGVYGLVLAGWASGSTYPLLGGLRSTAQVISYEIAMGLTFVAVFLYAGTMATSELVYAQTGEPVAGWFIADVQPWFAFTILFPVFIIYLISMVGETNRAPFDLPEAEGELVGGFHTEYSSLKFALFFLAEYVNMVTVSAVAATLYLGGWRAPWPFSDIMVQENGEGILNTGYWPVLWFIAKIFFFMFLFIWLRGTLPRLRYDQFMLFGWKVLIPLALVMIVVVALLKAMPLVPGLRGAIAVTAVVLAVLLILWSFLPSRGQKEPSEADRGDPALTEEPKVGTARAGGSFDAMAGGYPVPPLPGQVAAATAPRSATTVVSGPTESAGEPRTASDRSNTTPADGSQPGDDTSTTGSEEGPRA